MLSHHKQSGVSLVQVMVASGILGVVALGVMQLSSQMNQIMTQATSAQDQSTLISEIEMLLSNKESCRVSLAGDEENPGPLFLKTQVDGDKEGEGLDVELFRVNEETKNRGQKRFSASDPEKSKHGDIKIKDIKLLLNNGQERNYPINDFHVDQGELIIKFDKKLSMQNYRTIEKKIPLLLTLSTNKGGQTKILSCTNQSNILAEKKACENNGRFYKAGQDPACSISLNKVNELSLLGLNSGNMGVLRCPDGFGVTGLSGSSDLKGVGQLKIHCEPIRALDRTPNHDHPYGSASLGRGASQIGTAICPKGKWAKGIKVSMTDAVSGISLKCGSYEDNQKAPTKPLGKMSGFSAEGNCSEKTVIRELALFYNNYIQGVRAVCW